MKLTSLILIAAFMLAIGAHAKDKKDKKDFDQTITAIDLAQSTVTTTLHGESKTYHVGMFTGVFINGTKATIRELSVGMKITDLSLSDPGTIGEIKASGTANTASTPGTTSTPPPFATPPAQPGGSSTQTQAEAIAILTSGPWHFTGQGWKKEYVRIFHPDGTFTVIGDKFNDKNFWKIENNVILLSFSNHQEQILLPIRSEGSRGLDMKGQPIAVNRIDAVPQETVKEPKKSERVTRSTPASPESQQQASEIVKANHNNLVFVTGKEAQGSGFIASMKGANFLITNAHVAAGINGAAFKSLDGTAVQGGVPTVAVGEDIFCMAMPAGGTPLEVMQGVDENAAIGDEVVVLGNAEGAGVINTIMGRITGIGPNLVEVDAPFVPGNSGSPIIHIKSGKVIGVATYAVIQNYDATTNEKMKAPIIRRFGYRLDGVKAWQSVNWQTFYAQAAIMQNIETLTNDLGDFFRDLIENKGQVTPERHTNPVIKNRLDQWLANKAHNSSPTDQASANANFASFLKIACQSDVTAAQRQVGYDYFQRQLADEQTTRNEMSKAFEELIKLNRN
ncbi:MAG: serine protease [Chthoniobacteraceae bacterium]